MRKTGLCVFPQCIRGNWNYDSLLIGFDSDRQFGETSRNVEGAWHKGSKKKEARHGQDQDRINQHLPHKRVQFYVILRDSPMLGSMNSVYR
jgi:hypothetical protein